MDICLMQVTCQLSLGVGGNTNALHLLGVIQDRGLRTRPVWAPLLRCDQSRLNISGIGTLNLCLFILKCTSNSHSKPNLTSAHAGAAPWYVTFPCAINHTYNVSREGTNALDAAFLAYSSVSMLRQQIRPDHRVHGVVEGKHWQANGNNTLCEVIGDIKTKIP